MIIVSCWIAGRVGRITVTELLEMPGCIPRGCDLRWADPTRTDDTHSQVSCVLPEAVTAQCCACCGRWSHKFRGQSSEDAVIKTNLPLVSPIQYLQMKSKLEPLGLAITLLLLSFFWRTVFSKINWWAERNNLLYLTFQCLVGKHYWIRGEIRLRCKKKKKKKKKKKEKKKVTWQHPSVCKEMKEGSGT